MHIGTILTATDTNFIYIGFIPLFVKAWQKVLPEADIKIILIGDDIPESVKEYEPFITLIKPIGGMHTAFQAQCIRLLYPRQIERNEGVLITDMDIIPLSRKYYVDNIKELPDDAFVVYRDILLPKEISICYNVAVPSIWSKMFGNSTNEELLKEWYSTSRYQGIPGGEGWTTDQIVLVNTFNKYNGNKIVLKDTITKFRRLDRGLHEIDYIYNYDKETLKGLIKDGVFADYHCLRPHRSFKDINNYVVSCL